MAKDKKLQRTTTAAAVEEQASVFLKKIRMVCSPKIFESTFNRLELDCLKIEIVSENGLCDLVISGKTSFDSETLQQALQSIEKEFSNYIYGENDVKLVDTVFDLFIKTKKTLSLAESFTGGGIAFQLVSKAGASAFFKESLVTYSNLSKATRLNVLQKTIDKWGAVSDQTVYEMAANLFLTGNSDIVVATSGNAGPASEKPGQLGLCYIAIGDSKAIHIYEFKFEGDRESVIAQGVNNALFLLHNKLKEIK